MLQDEDGHQAPGVVNADARRAQGEVGRHGDTAIAAFHAVRRAEAAEAVALNESLGAARRKRTAKPAQTEVILRTHRPLGATGLLTPLPRFHLQRTARTMAQDRAAEQYAQRMKGVSQVGLRDEYLEVLHGTGAMWYASGVGTPIRSTGAVARASSGSILQPAVE